MPVRTTARASARVRGRHRRGHVRGIRHPAGQQGCREVGRRALLRRSGGGGGRGWSMRIRVEQVAQAAQARRADALDGAHAPGRAVRPSARPGARGRPARATASAQAGSAVSFTTLSTRPASVCRTARTRDRPAAGRPRSSDGSGSGPRGGRRRASRRPATSAPRRIAAPRLPARRRSASRTAAAWRPQNPRAASSACTERDVVDALREDRLEPGVLGPIPLPAQRAAGLAEGVREVDVRVRADRQAGHGAHRRRPGARLPARTGG